MSERKTRVWLASLTAGCAISFMLTAAMRKMSIGFWFPPSWPGAFLALPSAIARHGQLWDSRASLALVTIGNAAFYAWIFLRVLRAEILARGNLSRYFVS